MIGFGRYNLLLKLGQGGMGAVYLARQKTLRRYCAIKVVSPQISMDKEIAERFLREARATAALSHSNLVSVFDCDQFDGQYFIAMEYIEGMSLGEILRKYGKVGLPIALNWLHQAAVGLQYIHGKNVIHRDIKPDNMILDPSGNLKIMDLGLAKDHMEGDQGLTVTGMMMGSPQYMSPEQINDSKLVDHRADFYSLGISFYQMLVGAVPYRQSSAAAICVAHLQEPMPSVGLEDPELNKAVDDLILCLTAKNRNERISSGGDLLLMLQPWLTQYPIDDASQAYFAGIDFEGRKVARLLENGGIDASRVDADLGSAVSEIPVAAGATVPASLPVNEPSGFSRFKWPAIGILAILLILLFGKAIHHKKTLPPSHPMVVQKPAPPVVPANPLSTVGLLVVKTIPDHAHVILKAEDKEAPASFGNLMAGFYSLKAYLSGYNDCETNNVEVVAGKSQEILLNLERLAGFASIGSDPQGAEVIINGKSVDKTPCRVTGYDSETVECRLRMAGYQDATMNLNLKQNGGDSTVAILNPVPTPQSVIVPSNPSNGEEAAGDPRAQAKQKIGQILDSARSCPSDQWPGRKNQILGNFQKSIQMKNPGFSGIQGALTNLGRDLESARRLSDNEYQNQKDQLIMDMMQTMGRATGKMGGGGGQGRGGRRNTN